MTFPCGRSAPGIGHAEMQARFRQGFNPIEDGGASLTSIRLATQEAGREPIPLGSGTPNRQRRPNRTYSDRLVSIFAVGRRCARRPDPCANGG